MNKKFEIGRKYAAMLNGNERSFVVLDLEFDDFGGSMYAIQWDDGDEEWAYRKDMEQWITAAEER